MLTKIESKHGLKIDRVKFEGGLKEIEPNTFPIAIFILRNPNTDDWHRIYIHEKLISVANYSKATYSNISSTDILFDTAFKAVKELKDSTDPDITVIDYIDKFIRRAIGIDDLLYAELENINVRYQVDEVMSTPIFNYHEFIEFIGDKLEVETKYDIVEDDRKDDDNAIH